MTKPPDSVAIPDLARYILRRAKAVTTDARFILGISGPPGSGKSTLATLLKEKVNAAAGCHVAETAPMDGFHLPNAKLADEGKLDRKGAPDTFDAAEFERRLRVARFSDEAVPWPIYSRVTHEPSQDGVTIRAETRIVVTEGNYLLLDDGTWATVRNLLHEAWYLDVPMETISQRLIERHIHGGRSREHAENKTRNSDLLNAALVFESRKRADRMLTETGNWIYVASPTLA